MSLAEIQKAVCELPPEEMTKLTSWLISMDNEAWDRQMEADAESGKLDRLFEEADKAREDSTLPVNESNDIR